MKVFIYRNLNYAGHIYSIKSLEGISKGRVIGYSPRIVVENAELVVSQAGRERVLRQKRKNVHAGIVGDLVMVSGWVTRMHDSKAKFEFCNEETFRKTYPIGTLITYNPYLYKSFVYAQPPHQSIRKADRVIFCAGVVAISPK